MSSAIRIVTAQTSLSAASLSVPARMSIFRNISDPSCAARNRDDVVLFEFAVQFAAIAPRDVRHEVEHFDETRAVLFVSYISSNRDLMSGVSSLFC